MSTNTFSFLLVISSIGYSCQDQNESTSPTPTFLDTTLELSTNNLTTSTIYKSMTKYSTLPSVPYTYQSSTEHTDSTIQNSSFETTSMNITTENNTTITYTSTPEDTVSITNSTIPPYTNTSSIPDTTNYITTDPTEASTTSSKPNTTNDITTDATEAPTTPKESPTSSQNTDPSTPFMSFSPTTTMKPFPGLVDNTREERYYFVIPVALLVIIISILLYGVYHVKYRSSNITRQASRITKLDLGGLSKQEPILMKDLKDVVTVLHRNDNLLFSLHYECLSKTAPVHSCSEAEKDENRVKNRFINVLPFDHSRVRLSMIDDDIHSDYINANFLPGFNSSKEYIASQGPLQGTINDFWRMIWEYNVTIIVMLTSCKENGRPKCEQYWPNEFGDAVVYGDIRVENTSSTTINTYTCSVLHLTTETQSEVRVVKHFHYLTWKDMTASIERHDILEFISTIRQHITPQHVGPIVVHCSAGVGRTGTFIVLEYIMQYIQTHDIQTNLDIYGFIMKLRDYRVLIVQSESQYVFIYDCAVDLIEEKRKRLSEILNGQVKESGELSVVTCDDKQRTTSL